MFTSHGCGAFSVRLPNGYDISATFGQGSYSSNRNGEKRDARRNVVCPNAEIAVFKTGTNDALDLKSLFEPEALPFGDGGLCLSWAEPQHFVQLVAAVAALPDWREQGAQAAVPPADGAGLRPQHDEVSSC